MIDSKFQVLAEMSYAQKLIEMANDEYRNALKAKAHGMKNSEAMAYGRRRGILMSLEVLGVVPAYDIETGLYHL